MRHTTGWRWSWEGRKIGMERESQIFSLSLFLQLRKIMHVNILCECNIFVQDENGCYTKRKSLPRLFLSLSLSLFLSMSNFLLLLPPFTLQERTNFRSSSCFHFPSSFFCHPLLRRVCTRFSPMVRFGNQSSSNPMQDFDKKRRNHQVQWKTTTSPLSLSLSIFFFFFLSLFRSFSFFLSFS